MGKVLLIDAMNMLNRANVQFGISKKQPPSWDITSGTPEPPKAKDKPNYNIVYTALRMLRSVIEEFNAKKVFFCLEGANNFRYKLYPEYKANRIIKTSSEVDEKTAKKLAARADFDRQRDVFLPLLRHLPITTINADGFEADDVIATLNANMPDEDITILSGDSDLTQELQKGYKNLKLYDPRTKSYVVPPEYSYLHWKCLRGDKTTDNIQGLVGPKKAEKLLSNPDLLKEFMSSEENAANYRLNKELIELRVIPDDQLLIGNYNVDYDALKTELVALSLSIVDEPYWSRFVETFQSLE